MDIAVLESISQSEINGQYYDFHNDFECNRIALNDSTLSLFFVDRISGIQTVLKFNDVIITLMDFDISVVDSQKLTVDMLYRGRCKEANKLIEFTPDGKGYFYLDFIEGQKLEFWCVGFEVISFV